MSSENRVSCGNCGKTFYLVEAELNKCGTCNHYNKMLPDGNSLTYKASDNEDSEEKEEDDQTLYDNDEFDSSSEESEIN